MLWKTLIRERESDIIDGYGGMRMGMATLNFLLSKPGLQRVPRFDYQMSRNSGVILRRVGTCQHVIGRY